MADYVEGQLPQGDEADEGNIASPKVELEAAAAETELWTLAEMDAAEPISIEIDEAALNSAPRSVTEVPESDVESESVASGLPEDDADVEDDMTPTATSGGYNYPGPYSVSEVGRTHSYLTYPYVTVGKLFFKQNGRRYVGSAASIGNFAVFTAGHCVHMGNGTASGWSKDVVFVPAHKNGTAPRGQWRASHCITRARWYNRGIPNGLTEDMGGVILHPLAGKRISQRVGWLGATWNRGPFQHWHALGYPAASPYNGKLMWETRASYAYRGSVSGKNPVGIGCDMTGGCSGGPWVRGLGTSNQLNGVNSYRRSSRPQELFSPYFDRRARSLIRALRAATP